MPKNHLTELQIQRNASGRKFWELAESHRERVTQEILDCAVEAGGRLCVLGAGNCVDLALDQLIEHFSEIHLVDIDGHALEAAWTRHFTEKPHSLTLHGNVDVTGIWERMNDWSPEEPPPDDALQKTLRKAATVSLAGILGRSTVVVSVCMLSQLIEGVVRSLGERHPRLLEFVQTLRRAHLHLLAKLMECGGCGLLVTDFVSSVTAPQLLEVDDAQLPSLVRQLINSHNFFTGLNPVALMASLQNDPEFTSLTSHRELIGPWRWLAGPRTFAVAAIRFRRH